ncbi:DNA internalization-related competence protein ComEC/Rec2 [Shewanella nanhaiensis]|uniref:DNA internalization-related competence protein ComEC/Rec2 n=1 Tax=Shewanella nanhaiensis TaxID=2864872 RepID=A0ABS7E2W6_9GAMM|nr:DNA internalization-related competence protein ComEC/Rec2 [Shewanella nanhaiensis]MBW8183688.1 DNA internalization-related competence protein ComEC/Rec2 [Shewanella nanhaiensis]
MNRFMFGFCVTILSAMLWPSLPTAQLTPILFVIGALVLKRAPLISGVVLAVAWSAFYAQLVLSWDHKSIDLDQPVTGEIISLVNQNSDWVSMDFRLLDHNSSNSWPKKIRLSWKKAPKLAQGEIWELVVKPKPITSVLNQGGYNQQKLLLSRHIVSKGSVISGERIKASDSLRNKLLQTLKPTLQALANGDLILALLLGDRSLLDAERWHALRVTGAGHLVAISGLHLSVVGAWVFITLSKFLNLISPCVGRRNLMLAAASSAVACCIYAYLAGFALPTIRALTMLLLLVFLTLLNRYSSSWERLLFALFLILVIDPFSCLSAGFWLSFSALSIILLTLQARPIPVVDEPASLHKRVWLKLSLFWAIQWRLSLGLGLLQAVLFGGLTLYGVLFNFIFVPWFSLLVIPAAILIFAIWGLGLTAGFNLSVLFELVNKTLWPVTQALELFITLPGAWLPISDPMMLALFFLLCGLWLMAKLKSVQWKLISSVLLLPFILSLIFRWGFAPKEHWQVHLLDVGQGLSVVIERGQHGLVYDTGARYGRTFSYAERVVVPFIRARGITEVDYLVLSHSDNDHAGGASTFISAFPEVKLVTDIPEYAGINCRPKTIIWQRLRVEILAPRVVEKGNNGSCVVKVSDKYHQVLLTGDIESRAEQALLSLGNKLNSELLVAPHHGSRTSSTPEFIKLVSPQLVLFPSGFNNRYGFPKPDVLHRYQDHGAEHLISGREGQISVIFNRERRDIRTYRANLAPFWYNRLFEFGQNDNPE